MVKEFIAAFITALIRVLNFSADKLTAIRPKTTRDKWVESYEFFRVERAAQEIAEQNEWREYNREAFEEYADEFTRIFNEVSVKRAKNGRLMVRSAFGGSYKFAKGVA